MNTNLEQVTKHCTIQSRTKNEFWNKQHFKRLVKFEFDTFELHSPQVRANAAAREVAATLDVEDGASLELSVRLPAAAPLKPAEVECKNKVRACSNGDEAGVSRCWRHNMFNPRAFTPPPLPTHTHSWPTPY